MSPAAAPLRARELYRFYRAGDDETAALRGVSLVVAGGEMVAVAGPSGSGKSTLLSCLAGLDEPAGGEVVIAGERMTHRTELERARLRGRSLGILLQSGNLLAHLSVTANLRLAGRLAGRRRRDRRDGTDLLDAMGIGARAHATPAQLSGGERARAGLAVALVGDPAVLLADEPTGELDLEAERDVLRLLRQQADRGCAVVVVTHSDPVRTAADRVVEMVDGRVVA